MKKNCLFGLLLLAPVALISGCAGYTPLNFNANWHANTADRSVGNTQETLTYEVTFTPPQEENGFSVSYETGTYTTALRNDNLTLESGKTEEGYVYTTKLEISGHYTLNGTDSETFHDYVTTEVQFLPATSGLRPVKSVKESSVTAPLSGSPASMEYAYKLYRSRYEVTYNDELSSATAVYTDLNASTPKPEETTYSLPSNCTYLDNEQFLFALRGLTLNTSFAFATIHAIDGRVAMVNGSSLATGTEQVEFTMNGEAVSEEIATTRLNVYYSGKNSGPMQTLIYAQTTSTNNNRFRNVLVKMNVSVMQGLGTLTYRLSEAEFANK